MIRNLVKTWVLKKNKKALMKKADKCNLLARLESIDDVEMYIKKLEDRVSLHTVSLSLLNYLAVIH